GKGQIELTIHPEDADLHGIEEASTVIVETEFGEAEAPVAFDERMARGSLSLPNGQGMDFVDEHGSVLKPGVWLNKLTSGDHRDKFVGTPLHKFVPARIRKAS
ncbi:MAG: molybdopterin dinucleotide binding domain-containing protein, partial [Pseudomonadota bacterium]|nr:molybdopterin dinucleotide binding domain-containing protein [Pseudomonadota bacterium]